ncbi:anaerobic ribonucleoside-triphosphate reductase activating protein [Candidatus Micrarchaeota archaeon CG10_big_fil_rev_8_21_14_0_10_59_7]|nr:MAG: anaerobic ribonucleoside-triphosphate reductase activating protein [Candidatus Micrarchaeota archaeon CG10_big_fil_rev_8_21_14_0_10_59_7]
MRFGGIQKTSLIDFPGRLSTVLFSQGCNFRCPFCYNKQLVTPQPDDPWFDESSAYQTLENRKHLINAVVITGGEPTIQKDLPNFVRGLKERNFFVKLDTNGSNPATLKALLPLLDFVAMDAKCAPESYPLVTRSDVSEEEVRESASLLMKSRVAHEFRTTAVPTIVDEAEIEKIGAWLDGAERYAIQKFLPKNTLDPQFEKVVPYPRSRLLAFVEIAKKHFGNVELRD